jgi:drug/metabolite transporter (DMT)-like permease
MRSWGSLVRMAVLALFWGSSFLWIKVALGGLSPVQIAFGRLGLGALVLLALCLLTRTRLPADRGTWLRMIVPALFGNTIPFICFGLGEQRIDSGMAGVLNATTPLWALLISLLIRSERRLGALRITGLLLGFAGVLVIFAPWQAAGATGLGALACVLAAICYGISFTYIGRHLAGRVAPMPMSAAQVGLGAVLTAVALPIGGRQIPQLSAGPVVGVLVLGVLGTGIAYLLNNRLIVDEGATSAATVTYLVPVVSVLLGTVVLHEPLGARIVLGMVVVLLGVALTRRKPEAAAAAPLPVAEADQAD